MAHTYELAALNGGEPLRYHQGADLRGTDLSKFDCRYANLREVDLRGQNLCGIDFTGAKLLGANLSTASLRGSRLVGANLLHARMIGTLAGGVDFTRAVLYGADLRSANLCGAVLHGADVREVDFRAANLRGADLTYAQLPEFQICPSEGSFVAWKGADGAVLKLEVPADAPRTSSLIGRKCRATHVRVLESSDPSRDVFERCTDARTASVRSRGQTYGTTISVLSALRAFIFSLHAKKLKASSYQGLGGNKMLALNYANLKSIGETHEEAVEALNSEPAVEVAGEDMALMFDDGSCAAVVAGETHIGPDCRCLGHTLEFLEQFRTFEALVFRVRTLYQLKQAAQALEEEVAKRRP